MNARVGVMSYLPRFALAVVSVPLAFVLSAFAAVRFDVAPERAGAVAGALTFALVVLAPSTHNAAVRAGIACTLAALAAVVAFAVM